MTDYKVLLGIDDNTSGNTEKILLKILELLEEQKNELIAIKEKP